MTHKFTADKSGGVRALAPTVPVDGVAVAAPRRGTNRTATSAWPNDRLRPVVGTSAESDLRGVVGSTRWLTPPNRRRNNLYEEEIDAFQGLRTGPGCLRAP